MNSLDQFTTERVVSLIKAGDQEFFSRFYDQYSAAIYGIIFRVLGDEEVSKEVLQDAFIKFWKKIDQYDQTKGRLFTWMLNLSRNLAIDKLRSKEIRSALKTDRHGDFVSVSNEYVDFQSPDGIGLSEVLQKLREEERFVMEMVYFKGYTQSEIAKEYMIPIGTVKTRLRMALNNIRKILKLE